jgi:hypothetical protein
MDKKSKDIIKSAIEYFLKVRITSTLNRKYNNSEDNNLNNSIIEKVDNSRYYKIRERNALIQEYKENGLYTILNEDKEVNKQFDTQLINLNSLLDKQDQFNEVLEIEKQMAKIQAKKYITVKEFSEIYDYSSDWQKNRRGRIHDHLPFRQTTGGGKITYEVKEIEIWFENNNLSR